MNKLKDFIYNTNDILIALIILVVAIGIILWRSSIISEYPKALVAGTYVSATTNNEPITTPVPSSNPDDASEITPEGEVDSDGAAEVSGSAIGISGAAVGISGSEITGTSEDTAGSATGMTDTPEMFAIYINYGETSNSIAQKVVDVGFFETKEEFLKMVSDMRVETKIQTGNHIIPENATKEEVVTYLTEPGL